jgi:ABC-2 type transport system ATP-binding protein
VIAAIVETHLLTHRYGQRVALHELNLTVNEGEAVALLGPNGSGKTTLFRVLSTLVRPQDGRASILGLDLATHAAEVRRHLGVVFQSPSLDRQLTPRENLRHHGHLYGLRGAELRSWTEQLLAEVGLETRADEYVSSFSGGMRRRVELAKALLTRPRVLLMDEPSTGLDPAARRDLWRHLHEVRRRQALTILLTTHLLDEADECDRVMILDQGRLIALDTPAALKQRVGGDVISLTGADPQALRAALLDRLGIEADAGGPAVRFRRPNGHEFLPALVTALPGMIDSVSLSKPTLADVFLDLTGHALGDQADPASLSAA